MYSTINLAHNAFGKSALISCNKNYIEEDLIENRKKKCIDLDFTLSCRWFMWVFAAMVV